MAKDDFKSCEWPKIKTASERIAEVFQERRPAYPSDMGVADGRQRAKLQTDAKTRKNSPLARGLLDYFPLACVAVAELSRIGNEQHNPGQPMHWARTKSADHADCIARHLIDRGTVDIDQVRHSTKVAWRALAMLEIELEGLNDLTIQ